MYFLYIVISQSFYHPYHVFWPDQSMQFQYAGWGSLQGRGAQPGASLTRAHQSVPGRRARAARGEDWQRQLGEASRVGSIKSFNWHIFPRSFVSQSLDLAVPAFDIHSLLELGPALQELGLEDAFSPQVTWCLIWYLWILPRLTFLDWMEQKIFTWVLSFKSTPSPTRGPRWQKKLVYFKSWRWRKRLAGEGEETDLGGEEGEGGEGDELPQTEEQAD